MIALTQLFKRDLKRKFNFSGDGKPTKETFHKHAKTDIDEALKYQFIWINTDHEVNFLVFDDDNGSNITTLSEYRAHLQSLKIPYAYIIKTTKANGFQFGIHLSDSVKKDDPKAKALKRQITKLLHADIAGSHKMLGIWRNPLAHSDTISNPDNFNLSIEDLYATFGIADTKKTVHSLNVGVSSGGKGTYTLDPSSITQQNIDNGYYKGNRHTYFSSMIYKMLFEDRSLRDQLFSLGAQLNASLPDPISKAQEIKRIQSVLDAEASMHVTTARQKVRGEYSDLLFKMNFHGLRERRSAGGLIRAHKANKKAFKAIAEEYHKMNFESYKKDFSVKDLVKRVSYKKSRVYDVLKKLHLQSTFGSFLSSLFSGAKQSKRVIIEHSGKIIEEYFFKALIDSLKEIMRLQREEYYRDRYGSPENTQKRV